MLSRRTATIPAAATTSNKQQTTCYAMHALQAVATTTSLIRPEPTVSFTLRRSLGGCLCTHAQWSGKSTRPTGAPSLQDLDIGGMAARWRCR
ncbi:hypothetical protein ElyMa_005999300 [Elysia marginata]|uniref:Uncharacterized protein n=1 Tax=Elysia marginata TaxID=1093978 RepID=A0AAV4GH25_9GAST|nr:hypothetical protein ElyMa_005999300 [Elysia marginata]